MGNKKKRMKHLKLHEQHLRAKLAKEINFNAPAMPIAPESEQKDDYFYDAVHPAFGVGGEQGSTNTELSVLVYNTIMEDRASGFCGDAKKVCEMVKRLTGDDSGLSIREMFIFVCGIKYMHTVAKMKREVAKDKITDDLFQKLSYLLEELRDANANESETVS